MIWFVRIFIVFGFISLALAIIFIRVVHRQDGPPSEIQRKGIRRALSMTTIWFVTAMTVHICMLNVAGFVRGLPTQVLILDVSHDGYGPVALRTLTERIPADRFSNEEVSAINERIFNAEHWWMPETAEGNQAALVAADEWFRRLRAADRLMQSDFRRWIERDQPPVIGDALVVPGDDGLDRWRIPIEFGRRLAVTYELPYEIDAIEIVSVTIDDQPVEFTLTLSPESEDPSLEYFAHRIMYELVVKRVPASTASITVTYMLDIAITGPERLGPIAREVHVADQ